MTCETKCEGEQKTCDQVEVDIPKKHDINDDKFEKFPWDKPPIDRFNFVKIVLFMLGTICLLPMTFFITANEYWMYKFRNTSLEYDDPNNRTYLQINFASLQAIAAVYPMTIMNFIAAFVGHKIRLKTRVIGFLVSITLVLAAHTMMVKVNTDDWQLMFFLFTMLSQVVISVVMGIGGIGCMTVATFFPPEYTKMYLLGHGLAGILTAIMRLISIAASPSTIDAGFIYFCTGTGLIGTGSLLFYLATRTPFFRYYIHATKQETKKKINSLGKIFQILKIIWKVVLLNIITMVFPVMAVANLVVSEYKGSGNTWGDSYFVTIASYLTPAVCDIIGKGLSNRFDRNYPSWILAIIILIKTAVFGPMIFFSNALPRVHTSVIFGRDWEYILIMAVHAFAGSYIGNNIMLKLIRLVPKDKMDLTMSVNMMSMGVVAAATTPLGVFVVSLL
ncbi:equilibrative nucleoside transporter 1-like [Cylas formicarius]|uniref:equilibrative nucleoside transporter 1-like n=1 Tax=Cylas formicarius TaxID=197179 RepID=UPI0029589196|nr:equilibrative nucleoside transporter 1-like [Cylas formicarius]